MTTPLISPSSQSITGLDELSHLVDQTFCPMRLDPLNDVSSATFRGELHNTALNRLQLARIGSSALRVIRSKQDISQVSDGFYLVKFQIRGQSLVCQRGREAHLQPGDFVVCSSSEPYQLHFPDNYYQAVISIPQAMLQGMFHAPDDYLGVRMAGEFPVHGLLSQFVASLVQRIDSLDTGIVQRLEANLLDLLITSLHAEESITPRVNAAAQHLQRIKQFIAIHLKDPRLSPDFIACAEGISTRYLHMLFREQDSSVSRYIQQQRLEACHRALLNPALRQLSATDIALDWGFGDISHFHRCFKAKYQITPKQLRKQI